MEEKVTTTTEQKKRVAFILLAVLTKNGITYQTYEGEVVDDCTDSLCGQLHIQWTVDSRTKQADISAEKIGEAFVQLTDLKRTEARMVQLDAYNEAESKAKFKSAFAEKISEMLGALNDFRNALE